MLYSLNATTAKEVTSRHCFNKHQDGFLSQSPAACSSLLSLVLFLSSWITAAANQVAYEWSNIPPSHSTSFFWALGVLRGVSYCSERYHRDAPGSFVNLCWIPNRKQTLRALLFPILLFPLWKAGKCVTGLLDQKLQE